jgi:outer membrane protein assembly factor BamB
MARSRQSGALRRDRVAPTWSATQNIAWKVKLAGHGTSSAIVSGGLAIVTSQAGTYSTASGAPKLARSEQPLADRENAIGSTPSPGGKLYLVVEAFRVSDGKRLWEYRMAATGERPENHEKHNLATPTPVADGERIYAWFGNGQVVALTREGREIWRRHLGEEHGSFLNLWGHGSSPAIYKDQLILLCDHRPASYLLSLDARTGKQRWKADRGTERVSHSTPIVIPGKDGDELIVNSSERIDAYDPNTGKLLWHTGTERQTPIPSAVFHDGTIYLSRGYRNSDILALEPGSGRQKWRMPNGGSYVPSILFYEGLLYMTNEVGVVSCADAGTGAVLWKERLGGIFFASPVAGEGKVYMASETGETYVLRAGRKAEVLAKNDVGERLIASPAISGRRIYLRSDNSLFAVQ